MTECLTSPSRVRGSHDPFFSTVPGRLHAAPSPHPSPCPSPLRPRAAQPASPAFHPQLRCHPRHPLSGQSPLPQPSTPGGYQSSPTTPNNLGNPNLDPWRRPALIRLPAQRRCPPPLPHTVRPTHGLRDHRCSRRRAPPPPLGTIPLIRGRRGRVCH
jgi:hypothetical protein